MESKNEIVSKMMGNQETNSMLVEVTPKSYPMTCGNGPESYAQNSYFQSLALDASKSLIHDAIMEHFDTNNPSFDLSKPISLADLGCSTGPNTFLAMQNIIGAIEAKYKSTHPNAQKAPAYQVFFNDHHDNDLNCLFKSIPPSAPYYAFGAPGSFYGRLFPESALHVVHVSYALHWLSSVPKEATHENCSSWNEVGIYYGDASKEVYEAYSAQHRMDMQAFLSARAYELVGGGFLILVLVSIPEGVDFSMTGLGSTNTLLRSCLMDMAKMGTISKDKVDSFKLPVYYTSPEELKEVIKENGYFDIEKIEILNNPAKYINPGLAKASLAIRVAMEGLIAEQFGSWIVDEVFDSLTNKLAENLHSFERDYRQEIELFTFLKRNNKCYV